MDAAAVPTETARRFCPQGWMPPPCRPKRHGGGSVQGTVCGRSVLCGQGVQWGSRVGKFRRYAAIEPQRCYIVAVLTVSMSHRCGCSPGGHPGRGL